MSKLRLPFVQALVDRHGYPRHYFRRRGATRVTLPGSVGSAEFMAAYQLALTSAPEPIGASKRSLPGCVSGAIADYYGSQAFRSLAVGTQAKYRATLEIFREQHGDKPLASLPKAFVVALAMCWPLFHRWGKWEQYIFRGIQYGTVLNPNGEPREISMRRQRRHCEVCGKEQDELVRNG